MGTIQVGESQKAVKQRGSQKMQVTCTKSPDEDVCAAHIRQHSKHEGRRVYV